MPRAWRPLPLLASLTASLVIFAACARDTREADVRECLAQSQTRAVQDGPARRALSDQTEDERHDAIGGMVAACMEQRGYRHDDGAMTDERCVDDVDYSPYCYERRG